MNFINSNTWNKIRYSVYAPFYSMVVRFIKPMRQKSLELLNIQPNEKVLMVGAGTGDDFEFLKPSNNIVATDITPAMVEKMKHRSSELNMQIQVLEMDGHHLLFSDNSFDCVILHLVVAVIPDAEKCLQEVARVLKPGGRVVVLDKFFINDEKPRFIRRIVNQLSTFAFTTLNRNLTKLAASADLKIETVIPATKNNLFRIAKLTK